MKIYPVFLSHSGCAGRCSYCNQQAGSSALPPSPEEVVRQLQDCLPAAGAGEVAFYGGTFTLLDPPLQEAYCRAVQSFIRAGRVGGIRISTRPDAIDDRGAARLSAAGVTTVELGCQSFDAAVLKRCGRGYDAGAIRRAVSVLRAAGRDVGLQLMPGLPGGDRREAVDSLRRALSLRPDFVRIYPTVVMAGTRLENDYRCGDFTPWTLEEAVECCADLWLLCRAARVAVIRLGLQATVELDRGGQVVAGPYHPAFGQLVRSRLWRRALERLLDEGLRRIRINRCDLADATGHRRANIEHLEERFGAFRLLPDPDVPREHAGSSDRLRSLLALTA